MRSLLLSLLLVTAAQAGCKKTTAGGVASPATPSAPAAGSAAPAAPVAPPARRATAVLAPTAKFPQVKGTVTFVEVPGGVEVAAALEGLAPGDHGFHVHEKGDCSAPDAASAGGHFNPAGHKHALPDVAERHAGDLGNLTAGADGKATRTFTMTGISLGDGADSVIGKGFIVHEKADDGATQPSGNAGARVACGVISADATTR